MTRDLGEEEAAAEQAHVAGCVNETVTALAGNGTSVEALNSSDVRANISRACLATFKFDTKGLVGCLRGGLGGPQSMSCYKAIPVPKLASKSAGLVRCVECAKWLAATHTLRFTAEEHVHAGALIVLTFTKDALPLRAPLHGTCACSCVHTCMCSCTYGENALSLRAPLHGQGVHVYVNMCVV